MSCGGCAASVKRILESQVRVFFFPICSLLYLFASFDGGIDKCSLIHALLLCKVL